MKRIDGRAGKPFNGSLMYRTENMRFLFVMKV